MIDEIETPEDELDALAVPDFLNRASPEVIAIVEAGRKLSLEERTTELAKATAPNAGEPSLAPKPVKYEPKPEAPAPKPALAAEAKATSNKKSDAEMIKLIKEHREAAGGTAGKTLKVLRGMGISCSQERFKGLYAKA